MSTEIDSPFASPELLMADLHTVFDYIRFSVSNFNQFDLYFGHGTDSAWQEAHCLVFSALSLPLDLQAEEQRLFYPSNITSDEKRLILDWLALRCEKAIPLPYITHQAWFCDLPFYVDERVLIPRSPFAELIKDRFSNYINVNTQPKYILDMCTGSGCIAIALANAFKQAQVDATDIDLGALELASINIDEHQLTDRVFPIQSDLFENLSGQKYDLLIINPPYVDDDDMQDLPQEYLHEPELALASGADGLDITLAILKQASEYMTQDAWLFVEVGNSEVNTQQRFGDLELSWCSLRDGGSGIFAINKQQLERQASIIKSLK